VKTEGSPLSNGGTPGRKESAQDVSTLVLGDDPDLTFEVAVSALVLRDDPELAFEVAISTLVLRDDPRSGLEFRGSWQHLN
jgi:hypothetical protein